MLEREVWSREAVATAAIEGEVIDLAAVRSSVARRLGLAGAAVRAEMHAFLEWFNRTVDLDGLLRAGLAHVWFESIHPFEDGNGRVAAALGLGWVRRLWASTNDGIESTFGSAQKPRFGGVSSVK